MKHLLRNGNISGYGCVYTDSMMKKALLVVGRTLALYFALAWSPIIALAQPVEAPDLRCASVNVAGDVTLTWINAPDPGGAFVDHLVYSAPDLAGPFVQVGVITDPFQTTFLHLGAAANAGARFYYMTTTSSVPPVVSTPSDTVATLFLQVFQSTPLGSANLAWNAPAVAGTAEPQFTVWMEYPIGTWNLLGTVSSNTFAYQHVISICQDSLTFRVGLADAAGCISFSNRDGDVFEDVTPPSPPVIISVSVDSINGQPVITWQPSPEADTDGYIIVLSTPGGGVIIDTLFGGGSNTYTWVPGSPDLGPEAFTVAAFDTCRVGVPPSPNTSATRPAHRTMYATNVYDRCAGRVSLGWTPYVGWPVQTYQVLLQVDGGPWAVLQNVGGSDLGLLHEVEPDRTYCYIVKAIAQGGAPSSLSNRTCRTASYPPLPSYNYIRTVTVSGPEQITVVDSVDVSAAVRSYRFERSDNGGPFQTVALIPGGGGPLITYVDDAVAPDRVGYRYRVAVLDSCGNEALVSNLGGNIVLGATSNLYGENLLDWNGYSQWAGIVQSYAIERSVDGLPFAGLAAVPELPWSYTDNVQDLVGTTGRACYRITALEGGNPSGVNATSLSNVACTVQEELVYIPNAFIVGGANPVFQPVLSYADVSEYQLIIISRWGLTIWSTTDPLQPWDGMVSGSYVPQGVYGYYCTFKNGAGRRFEKRGTVTMLKAFE